MRCCCGGGGVGDGWAGYFCWNFDFVSSVSVWVVAVSLPGGIGRHESGSKTFGNESDENEDNYHIKLIVLVRFPYKKIAENQ